MAKLFTVQPDCIRIYHSRPLNARGDGADIVTTVKIGFFILFFLVGALTTGLTLASDHFHRSFAGEYHYPLIPGVGFMVVGIAFLRGEYTCLVFRRRDAMVLSRGVLFTRRVAAFAEIRNISLYIRGDPNLPSSYQYAVYFSEAAQRDPLPVTSPAKTFRQLRHMADHLLPAINAMIAQPS